MSVVIGCSVTMAWVYSDEADPQSRALLAEVTELGAWAPSLWRLEVANILEMGVRRQRHDAAFRDAALDDLGLLPIRIDPHTEMQAWGATRQLAAVYGLTVYDATYLELAIRLALPLATLDRELIVAAGRAGVTIWKLSTQRDSSSAEPTPPPSAESS